MLARWSIIAAMNSENLSTWLEIDLGAIRSNIHAMQSYAGVPVMAVIKANGYGHGLVEAGRAAEQAGAAFACVARIDEALKLREAGLRLPVLVLGYTHPDWAAQAAQLDIRLAAFDWEIAQGYAAQAQAAGHKLKVHLKVDCGMGRLGVFPEQALAFARQLNSLPGLETEAMFTHFPIADDPGRPETDAHIAAFTGAVESLQSAGLRPKIVHAANSAAALYFPKARFDMIRSGIAIYGLQPAKVEAPLPAGFRPALTWKARVAMIKVLPAGHGVGYNYRYTTTSEEKIGIIAAGYADGIRRRVGNFAVAGGVRVPVRSGMCMDQCMLGLNDAPDVKAGDEVVLIGRQGEASITAEELGEAWGTINYDVVCGLAARVPRFYLD